uniref:CSON011588 protein n=1 Tax=Culicoides sonorensis TaxID=179676 RepID=A0A336LGE1_CULSO
MSFVSQTVAGILRGKDGSFGIQNNKQKCDNCENYSCPKHHSGQVKSSDEYKNYMTLLQQCSSETNNSEETRSEFLGCMSLPIKNVVKTEINGTFKLQPQSSLTYPTPRILEKQTSEKQQTPSKQQQQQPTSTMNEFSQESSEDMIINLDDNGTGNADPIALSKKALHQRDADENLFLRFLELDPPVENNPQRRQSASLNYKSSNGRTPFTISKKLVKQGDRGFGMSIVWTHPPRVERVEPGLSAEKGGILPGDYIVFVDKENVVTMPEGDILNLIKAQGGTLQLEIFRRPASSSQTNGIKSTLYNVAANVASSHPNNVGNNSTISAFVTNTAATISSTSHMQTNRSQSPSTVSQQQQSFQLQPAPQSHVYSSSSTIQQTPTHQVHTLQRQQPVHILTSNSTLADTEPEASSSTKHAPFIPPLVPGTCSNTSIETSKRKLNLPQVTFSKEVGQGVIV